MTVSQVSKWLACRVVSRGNPNGLIEGISLNSREIRPGWVFVAIRGVQQDGTEYVADAIRRGAIGVVSETEVPVGTGVALWIVEDARVAAAQVASGYFGYASRQLQVVGITGTNGKTTTATLLKNVLADQGLTPGLLGTIAYEIGDRSIAATRTTPDAVTLQHLLQGMVKAGCQYAVLEVSSHALDQKRTACIDFAAAAFTNLTRDHLDYHKTMDAYYEAKALLLRGLAAGCPGVIDTDDPWGARLAGEALACDVIRTGLGDAADVRAEIGRADLAGTTFDIVSPWGRFSVHLPLLGVHNVRNALVCFALAGGLGLNLDSVVRTLGQFRCVRGRLQRVPGNAPFSVFVDYAHTDDALRNVLQALRPYTRGRLLVVFGCGGGRDTEKRAMMGATVYENADMAVITTDNPRNEDPSEIAAAVRSTFPADAAVRTVLDRRSAIAEILREARAGDTVCIAGKGHETYQEIEGRMLPFDDVVVAGEILAELGYETR